HADTGMSFGQIGIWIFLAGAGMPFFFMPLIAISMGAVNPEETASAAGLQNFIRTMSGAVATSFVTTAWENSTIAAHAKIAPLTNFGDLSAIFGGSGSSATLAMSDQLVQNQAMMIATNEIFMGAAVVFAVCATLAWTLPRPKGPVDMSAAH
ncbi:MAG: MFS transporter, partial [Asticcacaulis sp.]|nr:MFS transporter [Asticcacaulis sp.]